MIVRVLSIAVVSVLSTLPALAQSTGLPRYEVEEYCKSLSSFGSGSAFIYNGCIDQEQEAYDGIKARWSDVPNATRSHCTDLADIDGGSYNILAGCLIIELNTADSPSNFIY